MPRCKQFAAAGAIVLAVSIIGLGLVLMNGKGGFRAAMALSGVYAVAEPDGYPVVCFVNKSSGALSCVAKVEIRP